MSFTQNLAQKFSDTGKMAGSTEKGVPAGV